MEKITVDWAKGHDNIILVTYHTNDWQWPDFAHAFEQQRALLDQAKVPVVHILVDVLNSQLMPKGGSLLTAARNLGKDVHPRQGHTVIVGARGLVATMLNVVERFVGNQRTKIHSVPTLEAGYKMIEELSAQDEKQKV